MSNWIGRRHGAVAFSIETLETRRLLTGTIAGQVFTDLNLNGVQDYGDTASIGTTVFVDTNNNGIFDAGDLTTTTNPNGYYTFNNVPDGTYTVHAVFPAGYQASAPVQSPGGYQVSVPNLVDNQTPPGPKIGGYRATPGGSLSGYVFSDTDGNGQDDYADGKGDSVFAGGQAFLDNNGNGVLDAGTEPVALADQYGNFSFSGLAAGQYTIGFAPTTGYAMEVDYEQVAQVSPATGASGLVFPVVKGEASISGQLFNDKNLDGVLDAGESASTGGAVYIDLRNYGQFEPGDPIAQNTGGTYSFYDLTPGTYLLRATGGSNFFATGIASATVTVPPPSPVDTDVIQDFGIVAKPTGAYLAGTVRSATTSVGLSGVSVFLDNNNDGVLDSGDDSTTTDAAGAYAFDLTPGIYTVREVSPSTYTQTGPSGNAGEIATLEKGGVYPGYSFVVCPPGGISGKLYNSTDGSSVPVAGTPGLYGYVVYLDTNNDDQLDDNEKFALTQSDGSYFFGNVAAGNYLLRQIVPSGFATLNPASGGINVNVFGNTVVTYFVDTQADQNASVSGTVYGDTNRNGIFDSNEAGIRGDVVWDDVNDDGRIGSDEQQATTSATGTYTLHDLFSGTHNIRVQLASGQVVTAPTGGVYTTSLTGGQIVTGDNFGSANAAVPGSISGTVFGDANGNGTRDIGEYGLTNARVYLDYNNDGVFDDSDASVLTDTNGNFTFAGLAAGTYPLRAVGPSGYQLTTPAAGFFSIALGNGQNASGYSFGEKPPTPISTAGIDGTVFNDANSNLKKDATEAGVANITVYNDANNNGVLDAGEFSTTTLADGSYAFAGLAAGSYKIRQVLPTGVTQTTPTNNYGWTVSLKAGQTVTGDDFGEHTTAAATSGIVAGRATVGGTNVGVAGVTVFLDANNNSKLDAGELSTTTLSDGSYAFANVPAGAYILRQLLPAGYTQISPASNYGIHLTLAATSSFAGENFIDSVRTTSPTRLAGTLIGTVGSYKSDGNTIAKAVDNNLSTFFDGPTASGNFVGLDLGTAKAVTQISFAPRSGYASRMVGGVFQASDSADFSTGVVTLYTITAAPASGSLTTVTVATPSAHRYVRYLSPAGSYGDIAELAFYG